MELTVATFNVRGIRDVNKRRKIFNYLHKKTFDIVCLQEVHSTKGQEKRIKTEWGGQALFSHGESNSRGVAILFKKGRRIDLINVERSAEGRWIKAQIKTGQNKLTIVNCYAPNTDCPSFFKEVIDPFTVAENDCIIVGDFNTILSEHDMKGGAGNFHPKSTSYITQMMEQNNLSDIWRVRNKNSFMYTWMKCQPPVYKRLDYILISSSLQKYITSAEIIPAYMSDHSIPTITIKYEEVLNRGNGYWKLNNSLLADEKYIEVIEQVFDEAEQYTDPILKWEMIKMNSRGETIRFASRKKKSRENKITVLEKKLKDIVKRNVKNDVPIMVKNEDQIILVKKELDELTQQRANYAMLKTQQQWFDGGEKVSKYFLNMTKNQAKRRIITRLQDADGTIVKNEKSVMKMISSFYSDLFKAKDNPAVEQYLEDINIPKVKEDDLCILKDRVCKK